MKPLRAMLAPAAPPRDVLPDIARIVLLYAVFASLWIVLSDGMLAQLLPAPVSLQVASTLKGLAFVAVSSVLLFFFILRFATRRPDGLPEPGNVGQPSSQPSPGGRRSSYLPSPFGSGIEGEGDGTAPAPPRRGLIGGMVLLIGVFALLAAGGILQSHSRHRAEASAHLQAIARLKVAQIENWLEERRRDAKVVSESTVLREALSSWRKPGEPAQRARLLARLERFRAAMHYEGVWLADAEGEILLQTGPPGYETTAELSQAVRSAVAGGRIVMTDLFRIADAVPNHVHLDVVAPLEAATGGKRAVGAIILRVDVRQTLFAFLKSWPVPSESAETLIFRRDGDSVLFLNELRHGKDTALRRRAPLSDGSVLAVQALAPGYVPGGLLEGVDYRGTPVAGVVQPVAGTSWQLVAKADRPEIYAAAHSDTLWIVIASLLVLLATVVLALLVYQRRELQYAQQQRHAQADKLRALQLLDAVVGSSNDVIFAKDAEGRYLLFNNEAARVTGKSPQEILGHDDRHLFPAEQAERIMAVDRQLIRDGASISFQEKLPTVDGEVVFLATKGPLRDAEGQVVGVFGILRDITKISQTEDALQQQTKELLARNAELERFNRVVVGRELDMIVLKRLVNNLSRELGRVPPFALDFADHPEAGAKP